MTLDYYIKNPGYYDERIKHLTITSENYKDVLTKEGQYIYLQKVNMGESRGPNKIMRFDLDTAELI